jgi:leader peptidase (prepilin peptidase)/N-methyltransferase
MRSAIGCGVAAAAAIAVSVWRLGGTWAVVPFVLLAVVSGVLAWVDLTTRRLPNRIVLPALAASVVLLVVAAWLDGVIERWYGALIGGAVLFGLYLVLALVSSQGMGMGDVKLAAIVGLYGGYLGLTGWFVAAAAGFVIGGVVALIGIAVRKADRRSLIPFGPWMLAGLYVAVAVSTR